MAKNEKAIYLASVGTTKIVFAKAVKTADGTSKLLALSARFCDGFESGVVKDLVRASETLGRTESDVENEEEKTLHPCRVVISNAHLKSYTFQSSIYFHDRSRSISMKDVRSAIAQTRSVANIPLTEVILEAIPQAFLVNDLDGIQNPIGLEASRLGVTLRLITMDFHVYSNLVKVFERCELEIVESIPRVLASAAAVLSPEEKQNGVLLVDIGGTVTHFACYQNSVLIDTSLLPMGSDHVTEAMEKKLNLSRQDARRVKEAFGSAAPKDEFKEELVPIHDSQGNNKFHIKRSEFEEHLTVGLQSFLQKLEHQIKHLQQKYAPLEQVVFTGGGSRLDGLLEIMRERVSPTGKLGVVSGVLGPNGIIDNPSFAHVLGAINYSSRIHDREQMLFTPSNWFERVAENARNWVFEYF